MSTFDSLINGVFSKIVDWYEDIYIVCRWFILTPRNENVKDRFQGQGKNINTVDKKDTWGHYPTKFLNLIILSGIRPHSMTLKLITSIILAVDWEMGQALDMSQKLNEVDTELLFNLKDINFPSDNVFKCLQIKLKGKQ